MTISFDLGDDLKDIVEMVHKLASEEIRPRMREFEHEGGLPEDLLKQLHGLGLTTLSLPAELGGPGLDLRSSAVLQEELAWGDVGVAIALSGPRSAGAAISMLGDTSQKERFLKPFAADDAFGKRGAVALVEGPFGLSPDAVETTARRVGDEYVLDGKKRYVLNAAEADLTVVLARDLSSQDTSLWNRLAFFVVEGRPAGLIAGERHRTLGLNTGRYANLSLEGVRVPEKNRLKGRGDGRRDVLEVVARKRVLDAARLVGCSRAASEYAFKYSTERHAFGKPLFEHQALAFMMADMATKLEATRWLVWRAAWSFDSAGPGYAANAIHEAAVAFRHAADLAVEVTTDAVQILGGHGYIQDHPVEKWMRDARCLGLVDGLSVDDDATIAEGVLA
ncbi:acyl-CoA dehydrogenase family protein [bacterium]|nr:acyl-CoA dehydrogenase family protein [bacterium]